MIEKSECDFYIHGECNGLACKRPCAKNTYWPKHNGLLFQIIWMPIVLVAIFFTVLLWW
jgi:hypothetical protein